ncbi:response regulator [Desulfotalea psychrophila]|uniref:histidine kinase n=1 Tax=Desulfotalea psychrophila (strain LSv54 / DSM 12343) TaxID=177439 RepID=Q6AQA4_DESPS|nr:response regulator [Desulfotalea psychrophila]CAG35469.1 related to two-component system sensory/regulatory protein (hybrid family) [Desulfotalea psychrophila LSv54]
MAEKKELKRQVKGLEAELAELRKENILLKKKAFISLLCGNRGSSCCLFAEGHQQASKSRNIFIEEMDHAVRSSLNNILGALDILSDLLEVKEQQEYVDMATNEALHLSSYTTRIFDLNKVETGDIDIRKNVFHLKEVLDHELESLSFDAHGREIELSCDIAAAVPHILYGDSGRLAQIIEGIVGNRVHYMQDGAAVAINVSSNGFDELNRVVLRFSVTDTGIGFPERIFADLQEFMERQLLPGVFQPLIAGGASYDLMHAIRLIRLLGGVVGLESTDRGVTFYFSLAYEASVEEEGAAKVEQKEKPFFVLEKKRVLLVEDDLINRILVTKVLQQQGLQVVAVVNGQQAVDRVALENFDVILMDIQMPVLGGLDATRKIRAIEKKTCRHSKIIALTALSGREKCLQAGMDGYLAKPINKKDLLALLTESLTPSALIVHDDFKVVQTLVRALVRLGWRVTTAEASRQALYEVSLNHFDVVLLHTELPLFRGASVLSVVRKLEKHLAHKSLIIGIGEKSADDKNVFDAFLPLPLVSHDLEEQMSSFFVNRCSS